MRPRLEVLGHQPASDGLSRFAEWYLSQKPNLPMRPPIDQSMHALDGIRTLVVWREGRFQVELAMCDGAVHIPEHSHPNVDSYEVHLNGGVDFIVDGRRTIPLKLLDERWYGFAVRVRPNVQHSAQVDGKGGAFLSIQEWAPGVEMSSVAFDWQGRAVGEQHERRIHG